MGEAASQSILLVDDDTIGRTLRKLVLESNGHQVIAVPGANAALLVLEERQISLVIVDYFLDGMTGIDLAKQVRQSKPLVPILLLSGACDVPEGIENVDGYLSKLESVTTIEERIMELLDNRNGRLRATGNDA